MPVSANSWYQSTSLFYSCSGSSHLAQQHQMSNKKFALLDMLACPCCSHPCSTSHGSSKSMTGTHDWICYVMTAPPMQINFARGGMIFWHSWKLMLNTTSMAWQQWGSHLAVEISIQLRMCGASWKRVWPLGNLYCSKRICCERDGQIKNQTTKNNV